MEQEVEFTDEQLELNLTGMVEVIFIEKSKI